jgi:maltooligosyltrehalose trehalohydrolase
MPFGAEMTAGGTRFALWAPTARDISLLLDDAEMPMPETQGGWRELVAPRARAGSRYGFRIDGRLVVPDPASRWQPDDVHGLSQVIAPLAYDWSDAGWKGRPWEETVLYELHVGTVTREGTFAALMGKLDALKETGITAIEFMPIADFPGRRGWGYDGVLPFAPDAAYGAPDDLKRLVDRAHAIGMMVFLDVVYNHFGPSGNYLHAYAEKFFTDRHQTPWGAGINFDGANGRTVRDFFVHNALYWLEEYHIDGLRLDAVHAILDDSETHILEEIAARARNAFPDREIHLVLENDANEARWLERGPDQRPKFYTAQWDDDLHHCWHTLLTGESDGYYVDYADRPLERLGRGLAEGFVYQGEGSAHRQGEPRGEPSTHLPPSAFVSFLQNHDQIGNRAYGDRLTGLTPPECLSLARAGLLLAPQIPLIFMGEEWASSTPFLFFVDFSDDEPLAKAVREGRRREFAAFKSFGEHGEVREIPDPTREDTLRQSCLDWSEAAREPHAGALAETRALLAIRQREIVPLTLTRFRGAVYREPGPGVLDVVWQFDGGTLRLLANFSDAGAEVQLDESLHLIWQSPSVVRDESVSLPSWAGLFAKGAAG